VFKGLDDDELAAWTDAMMHSGAVLDHSAVPGRKVDKHSTGGVGDKISLCLAPAVAALGVRVPMVSGRGLGHTGGTLDKLESIPGFRVDLSVERSSQLLADLGIFLVGQTADLVPADRKLYALRDVTGTVESIPLIASSIMSKKLAEGIDGLVLDVKVGAGAFMRDLDQARELTTTMIGIGRTAGVNVRALLTDMSAPIGRTVGNALEVREAIEVMRGEGPTATTELTVELGAEMLVLGGACTGLDDGRSEMTRALKDGRALELFARLVEAQGGDPGVCDDPARLPTASEVESIEAASKGVVTQIRPRKVALAALELGAGRKVKEDVIDPATGVELAVDLGDRVTAGEPLATLHHNRAGVDSARALLSEAFEIGEANDDSGPLIIDRM
ncbi:MAG: thymidine phosphorylase, partial [Deltaproteobacteria bacterium]|nr:thymidine phosphorylase [Deltaproteobacteria bacterium]